MADAYQFLGLPQSQWQFINSFSDWFSAIGTIAAVWISLWLARSAARPKARFTVSVMVAVGNGNVSPEFLYFKIVNTGDRPLAVTAIGWRLGPPFMRRFAYQQTDAVPVGLSNSPMPVELTHGQTGGWHLDIERIYQRETWVQDFAKKMLGRWPELGIFTLRAQAFTSTGHVFTVKPDATLLKKLRAALLPEPRTLP